MTAEGTHSGLHHSSTLGGNCSRIKCLFVVPGINIRINHISVFKSHIVEFNCEGFKIYSFPCIESYVESY